MERRRQGNKETGKEVKKQSGHGGEKEGNKKAGKFFPKLEYTRVVLEKQERWKEGDWRGSKEAWK